MSKHADEKKDSASPEPAFHIRPVRSQDGKAVLDILQRTAQHSIGDTRDGTPSFEEIQRIVSNASVPVPDVLFLVAERSAPLSAEDSGTKEPQAGGTQTPGHGILGFAALISFVRGIGHHPKSCYNRTATLRIEILHGASLDREARRRVMAALVREVLTLCRERGFRYKTVVMDRVFREDLETAQDLVYTLQEEGFRVAGMLEEVIEKNGLLLNVITLQRNV